MVVLLPAQWNVTRVSKLSLMSDMVVLITTIILFACHWNANQSAFQLMRLDGEKYSLCPFYTGNSPSSRKLVTQIVLV